MYIKIIAVIIFAISAIFLVRYFVLTPDSAPVDTAPGYVFTTSTTPIQPTTPVVHTPGTLLSKNAQSLSDVPLVTSANTSEIRTGFYQNTDNSDMYGVYYLKETGNLTVTLYGEDTKRARVAAEKYIKQLLPYTETQLCNLDTTVVTNEYENPRWAGMNLGFSFCAGSVDIE